MIICPISDIMSNVVGCGYDLGPLEPGKPGEPGGPGEIGSGCLDKVTSRPIADKTKRGLNENTSC